MKVVKKLLCAALALSMLPIASMNASASQNESNGVCYMPGSWGLTVQSNNTPWNLEQDYMRTTVDGGYNGTPGLEINIQSAQESNRFLAMGNSFTSALVKGSTYRVKLRYKGGSGNFTIHLEWGNRSNASSYNVESTDGEWKYVYKDVVAENAATYIDILCEAKQSHVIDDVSVQLMTDTDSDGTPDTPSGTELVNNGDFSKYSISYTFDLEDANRYTSNSWDWGNYGLKETSGGVAQITSKYARTDKYAMYMKGETADGYMIVKPKKTTGIAKGNTYFVEFYAKSVKNTTAVTSGWNRFGSISGWTKSAPDADGWVKYSKACTIAADSQYGADGLWFLLDSADELVVDDVSVRLMTDEDVDGTPDTPTGNNLVTDGGFENVKEGLAENAYKFNNWVARYHDADSNAINADTWNYTYYAEPTKNEKYDGEYSLHITHPGAVESNQYVLLTQEGKSLPVGNYYLSMYVKGTSNTLHACMGMGVRKNIGGTYSDWTKKEWIITETAARTTFDLIAMGLVDMYIDNIELYAAEAADSASAISLENYKTTGENLVTDGTFDNITAISGATNANLVAYPTVAGGALNISWKNPDSYYIDDIKLYVDGKLTRNTTIDKTYGAFNEMYVNGLTNYKEYPIELVITMNGEEYTFTASGIPDTEGTVIYFDEWAATRTEVKNGNFMTYPNSVVTAEKSGDNTAMRINTNIPEITPFIYANLQSKTTTLRVDTQYILQFKYKAEDVSSFSVRQDCVLDSTTVDNKKNVITTKTTTDGWENAEIVLAPSGIYDDTDMDDTTYKSTILFLVEAATGSVWLDDVKLYAIDTMTGNLGTTDLLGGDGDFEFDAYTIAEPEYKVVAADGASTPINAIQAGNIEVTTKIKNNSMGDNFKASVVVALYNGDKLEKFSITEKTVAEKSVALPADEVTASIVVPESEDSNYIMKVMYWNGLDSLVPLKANDEL